ncbi:hypothetical protein PACTADRAFT_51904 [Pachysolen tannophilus NRRL Y-2460]|uniref:Dipeptidyl aminopeptidase A n=1 Tax=Pachysolen tannophilus NRRL Y-2460 TaxID=669874 RepID=A0A1E4TNG4_PACTA|nr:hypothetical protein PACTADRAFT_51904 [Pachysolen tannophilus NRRL Y-2460]
MFARIQDPFSNNNDNNDRLFDQDIELQQASSFVKSSSDSSSSCASIVLENLNQYSERQQQQQRQQQQPPPPPPASASAPPPPIDQSFNIDDEDYYRGEENNGGLVLDELNLYEKFRRRWMWKQKQICLVLFGVFFIVWLIALISYSKGGSAFRNINKYTPEVGSNRTDLHTSRPSSIASNLENPVVIDGIDKKRKITLDELRTGRFYVHDVNVKLLDTDYDDEGVYLEQIAGQFVLRKNSNPNFKQVILEEAEFQYGDEILQVSGFELNHKLDKALISTDVIKEYRYSSFARYWIYDLNTKEIEPLYEQILKDNDNDNVGGNFKIIPGLSFAQWSPMANYVTFVLDNNVFVKKLSSNEVLQLTTDGSSNIFNGKSDWIYEEEVLGTDVAIWWAPDESGFVFLTLNDTNVPTYDLEFFVQQSDAKYPVIESLKYPKPGYNNPIPTLHSYNVIENKLEIISHLDSKLGDDFIVYDCAYIDNENVLIKETDRESNILDVRVYNPKNSNSKVVRTVDAVKEYNGWHEQVNAVTIIPPSETYSRSNYGYVDQVVIDGYPHLAYFAKIDDSSPYTILTSGDWEVLNDGIKFNAQTNKIFFLANKKSYLDHHLYSVNLDGQNLTSLTNDSQNGHYTVNYSPSGRYCVLNYKGPDLPIQKIVDLNHFSENYYEDSIAINNNIKAKLAQETFQIPKTKQHEVTVMDGTKDSLDLTVIEVLPENFDPNKKYPLLVSVYGGPGSQKLSLEYEVRLEQVICSSLDAIVIYIDPRGTGGRGWKFRSYANKNLGYWEPRDITDATKLYMESKSYIDTSKVAIWGWSYGGYTTLKTLEYDTGNVFKYGMAVAPVTDWTFYDSVYTERYMDKPLNNKQGYKQSSIKNIKNFANVKKFLIMHGTADDNVHFQNTLSLLDKFDTNSIENYDVHIFPDSNHSIYYNNANTIVFDKLYNWLKNAFEGKFQ